MNFMTIKEAIQTQLDRMCEHELFEVEVERSTLWDLYLSSFAEGTNPIYKERTEHDCNCCKSFIRQYGNVVAIIDGKVESLWDVIVGDNYQVVVDALAAKVKGLPICDIFRNDSKHMGINRSRQMLADDSLLTWDHFYYKLPNKFVITNGSIPTWLGDKRTDKEVLERSLKEITTEAINIVSDLIAQNSIYRGTEHKSTVQLLKKTKGLYDKLSTDQDKTIFCWNKGLELGHGGRFRNTVIGTLLVDISKGTELDVAVKKFEDKVAPHNYKRSSTLITQGMIKKAQEKVELLGIEESLHRRFAITEDITVNNVLFADRSARQSMGVFDSLQSATKGQSPNLDKVQEVGIQEFVDTILPKIDSMEVMAENRHSSNFVSLIAPECPEAKNIFKWDNNFSWSYNGEVTDSIKERVKKAGGAVSGYMRTSLSWYNSDDLDIHVVEPNGNRIHFGKKISSLTGGKLDVDMNAGSISKDPVENIVWPSKSKMREGDYIVAVNNYQKRSSGDIGFQVEVEFDGNTYLYTFDKPVPNSATIPVLKFNYSIKDGIKVIDSIPEGSASKELWGVNTHQWTKASLVMNSPNHWDGNETGNKHWFFMLDGCANPDGARGFYNEFLDGELTEHRKVFEVLASKMKVEESDKQLSGLGFSSTQNNSILCKVSGSFNRTINIKF